MLYFAMLRYVSLLLYVAPIVNLCFVSSIERILALHVVIPRPRQYLHLYTDPKATSFG